MVEHRLGLLRQRGRFAARVVAGEREHRTILADAGVIGVLQRIAAAIDARTFAVPHPKHAVVLRLRNRAEHLRPPDSSCREILVETVVEHDVMVGEELMLTLKGLIENPKRRAAISSDKERRVETAAAV